MEGGISSLALKIVVTMAKRHATLTTSLSNLWQSKRHSCKSKEALGDFTKKGNRLRRERQRLE